MGSSVSLPERVPPAGMATREMVLSVSEMLHVFPNARLGDIVRIGPLNTNPAYFPRILEIIKTMLPEFEVVSTARGLFGAQRTAYSGDTHRCCTTSGLAYYWDDSSGEIFDAYALGRSLRTCAPGTQEKGSACDDVLFKWCSAPGAAMDICRQWLSAAFQRRPTTQAPDDDSLLGIIAGYSTLCAAAIETPMCEMWLGAMRAANTEAYDAVIDAVLAQQPQAFKDAHMRCSYPDQRTQELAARVAEPRECWDDHCVRGNVNFMLSENYHALARCHVYRCNVSIGNLIMDARSKLRVSCHDPLRFVALNKTRVVEENLRDSFRVDLRMLAALGVFIAWLLIAVL
uniref:Poxvirus myristoylprotein n=1 Tax=Rousettus bat poxvirus TaxID=3141933 RepID=A0AAU7E2F0_9POXV